MATQLKIKRRTADAAAPTGLTAGEMAINLVDKKLYVGGSAGTNVIFLDSTSSVGLSTANTFTALQTFSAGISASGATFTGSISGATATFSKDITVNSMTVGLGGGGSISNIALGQGALVANTDGTGNSAIGGSALGNNTEGTSNVALGGSALLSNTIGSNNIAIGAGSIYYATGRENNIAIGVSSLQGSPGITGGPDNVGIGYYSLGVNTSGSSNTGIGTITLTNTTTASQMTALGYAAGSYRGSGALTLTTGTGGIYIGYQARGSANARTNEIVIGADALGLGSNTAVIGATLQSAATIYGLLNLPSGLSASGATFMGNISAPNIVTSFNGATGTVTGASLGANTFTALNTFSAGISASGATFGGTVNHQDNTLSRVEFLDYFERFVDLGDFTNKLTQIPIDLSTAQVFRTKLTTACTGLSVTNTPDNGNANAVGFSLLFVGDGSARTMTWNIGNTAASWAGGTAPTYTSTLNKIDVYSFLSRDGGSTWLGFVGGQNF